MIQTLRLKLQTLRLEYSLSEYYTEKDGISLSLWLPKLEIHFYGKTYDELTDKLENLVLCVLAQKAD